ncbi:MAG: hypothetical protein ACKVP7_08615 [Hyphomicrobiaceae bacterium]
MTHSETTAWFAALPGKAQLFFLLEVVSALTIVVRDVSTLNDKDQLLRACWAISELNHRLVANVTQAMAKAPRYPDDVIIGIMFDTLDAPELQPYTRHVVDTAAVITNRYLPTLTT